VKKKPSKASANHDDSEGCEGCGSMLAFLLLVALCLVAMWGGPDRYYKCDQCGSPFLSPAWRHGLPGQMGDECRFCGGRLRPCTKAESGWRDGEICDDGKVWR